jgi:hypothetical protein
MERRQGTEEAAASSPAAEGEAVDRGLLERARAGDPAAMRAVKRRRAARQQRQAGNEEATQRLEGDPMVLQVGVDGQVQDAEAEAARALLRDKIRATERAIMEGAAAALLRQLGAGAEEAARDKAIDAVREPLRDKLLEFVKGKVQAGKVRGGGATGRALRNRLASEGSQLAGKAIGAAAVVGIVKDVTEAVGEAELAGFTADTWQGLIDEIKARLPPAFDAYYRQVDAMDAQSAVDAAAGETAAPWVSAARVQLELTRVFNAIEIDASARGAGPLKGGALFDKVQTVLHGGEE